MLIRKEYALLCTEGSEKSVKNFLFWRGRFRLAAEIKLFTVKTAANYTRPL